MPIQSTDTNAGITFTADSQAWIVSSGVTVYSNPGVTMGYSFGYLSNHGAIESSLSDGVSATGSHAYVHNAADGTISSHVSAVYLTSAGGELINEGVLSGGGYGVL